MSIKPFVSIFLYLILSSFVFNQESSHLSSLIKAYENEVKNNKIDQAGLMAYEIALQYTSFKKHTEAIDYFEKAIAHGLNDKNILHDTYEKVGAAYLYIGKHRQAINYLKDATKIAEELNDPRLHLADCLALGIAQEKHKKYKDALYSIEQAAYLAEQLEDIDLALHSYDLLIQVAKKSNKHKKVIAYQNKYTKYDDLLTQQALSATNKKLNSIEGKANSLEQEQIKTAAELHKKNEELISQSWELYKQEEELNETKQLSEEQASDLALLSKQKEIDQLRISEMKAAQETQSWIRNSIILLVLAVSSLTFFIYRDYKHQKKAKETLTLQKDIIENQKNEIEAEHEKMKASINYAQRIQEAALPLDKYIKSQLPNSFVFFQPRDVVSGDFYWYYDPMESNLASDELHNKQVDHQILLAAIDCTGHGVPGAFMSMIAFNLLNRIVSSGILAPHEILNKLNKEVRIALKQEETNNLDGMDMAICAIDKKNKVVTFSGAKNPLVYIKNGELNYIKGSKHPIGGAQTKEEITFTSHEIAIEEGDIFYMYSDGVIDQFGGEDGRKFMSKKFKNLLLENHQLPMDKQKSLIEKTMSDYMGKDHKQLDDMLVMGFKV